MHRTQISLEEHQYKALLTESRRQGVSLSAVLGGLVEKHLTINRYGADSIGKLAGIAKGTGESIGRDHNRLLYRKVAKRRAMR